MARLEIAPGKTRIGWVGTGVMGSSMCAHLIDQGFAATVFTRSRAKAEALLAQGAAWADSPRAVAEASDVIFSIVGFPADVREVTLGGQGTLAGCKTGDILVDMTTSEPSLAIEIAEAEVNLTSADLIVDALIGYSLRGAPRGAAAVLIREANALDAPVLSLDVPSGVDATTGTVYDPAVRATATLTLALPKRGLRTDAAREHVGELYLADIGVPPGLYGRPPLGLDIGPLFAQDDILRVW